MTIHSLLICPSLSLESGLRTSRARGFALAPSPRDAQNARPFFVPGGFVIPGRTDRCEPGIQTQARCRLWIPGPACGRPGGQRNVSVTMPKRTDIKSILIIGAGPIVI